MKRLKAALVGLALLVGGLAGCKQRLFLEPGDYEYAASIGLPPNLENDPHATILPPKVKPNTPPATVLDPARKKRFITLAEAMAIALEQGTTGFTANLALNIGSGNTYVDNLVSFGGQTVVGDDSIRALALDPAIVGANIERSLSKFDAQWISSMNWQKQDNAVQNLIQNFQNGDFATLSSALLKPLPTGGVAGITFSTDYTLLETAPAGFAVINPAYRPRLQVAFEQPLLQGYGVEINQLSPGHPGSVLSQLAPSGGQGTEGILITRLRYEQSQAEFLRVVNSLLANVEAAYWTLYASYFNLYAQEQALRQSFKAYELNKVRFEAGAIPRPDLAQTEAQFRLFQAQRTAAVQQVLENERQLRGLLGLPVGGDYRLVPADSPTLAPVRPDWDESLQETIGNRPELVLARQDLKFRQLDLRLQKNALLPDLRFTATYDINGIGTRLDGPTDAGNALGGLAGNTFNTWTLGLQMNMPLGFRDAHALTRIARLNLARSYAILKNQELKATRFLERQYQQIFSNYESIKALRANREANAVQLAGRFREFEVGRGTLDILLEAQRFYADAVRQEYEAIANYNIALSNFQFAKGASLVYNNIQVVDAPLPNLALARAIEHYEQRTRALVLRERQKPAGKERLSLPTLLHHTEPLPDIPMDLTQDDRPIDPLKGNDGATLPTPKPTAPPIPPTYVPNNGVGGKTETSLPVLQRSTPLPSPPSRRILPPREPGKPQELPPGTTTYIPTITPGRQ